MRALNGKTLFKAWNKNCPDVHYLKTFGCIGHVKNTSPGLKKLDDRSSPMIFVVYEDGSKANRFFDPSSHSVVISCDAVFVEASAWKWRDQDINSGPSSELFSVEHTVEHAPRELSPDPLKFHCIDNIIGPSSPPGLAARVIDHELHCTSAEEPPFLCNR